MSAKIKYTDEPLGKTQVIPDFLPSPAELAFREEGVKVTLALSKKSLEFFKSEAAKHQTQYQRMIRRLLDAYVDAQALTLRSRGLALLRQQSNMLYEMAVAYLSLYVRRTRRVRRCKPRNLQTGAPLRKLSAIKSPISIGGSVLVPPVQSALSSAPHVATLPQP